VLVASGALLADCQRASNPPCPDASPACAADVAPDALADAVADDSWDAGGTDAADAGGTDAWDAGGNDAWDAGGNDAWDAGGDDAADVGGVDAADAGPIDVPGPRDALDAAPSDTGDGLDAPTPDLAADVPASDQGPADASCTRGERRGTELMEVCIPPWGWLRLWEPRTFCDARGCVHTPSDRWLLCYADTGVCERCNGSLDICVRCNSHEVVGGALGFNASECVFGSELPAARVGYWGTTCAGGRCENVFEDGAVLCADPERCVFDVMRELVAGTRHESLTCLGRVQVTLVDEVNGESTIYVPGGSHWSRDRPVCCGTYDTHCFAPGDAGAPTGTCRPEVTLRGDDGDAVLCTAVAPRITTNRGRICCEDGCVTCTGTLCGAWFVLAGEADACPDR